MISSIPLYMIVRALEHRCGIVPNPATGNKTWYHINSQIPLARQTQIGCAFRAGRAAAAACPGKFEFQIENPYSSRDGMPEQLASVRAAQWHAFAAGISRERGNISNSGISLRNARFCMRRAVALGRA